MRIQHNIPAMSAYRHYTNNTKALAKNLEKLSSGYKINRAGDDAAGLAISEKMRAQITGLEVAQKNAKDGISLVQTAEGALTEVHDMLNRMYSLAEQSANGTYDNEVDRVQLQKELDSLKTEINRISKATNFNGIQLLDGSLGEATSTAITKVENADVLNLADGVTINAPRDGDGKKASLEVKFDNENGTQFGAGDSVTFKLKDENGVEKSYTFNYDSSSTAGADPTNPATGKFTGSTFADQLSSLATQITATRDFGEYTATVETDSDGKSFIKIEARNDATIPNKTLIGGVGTGVIVKDQKVKVETASYTPGANYATAATQSTGQAIKNLIVGGTPGDLNITEIQEGATVKFDFSVNGKTMSITLKAVGENATPGDKEFKIGNDTNDTTTNIVNALANARFDDNTTTTAIDESQIKFSDYFQATANHDGAAGSKSGSIKIAADSTKAGNKNNVNAVTQAQITSADGTAQTPVSVSGTAGTAASGTAAVAESTEYKFSNTFSAGDEVTLTGKLSDGRDFEVTLKAAVSGVAGDKTFTMGNSATDSVTGIKNALTSSDCKVKVTDSDGNITEVDANAIFATSGTSTDFVLTTTGDTLKIENSAAGAAGIKGATAKFSNLQIKSVGTMTATDATATAGQVPGKAENIITFDDPSKIENGTTITIDGKNYEFVTDASRMAGDPTTTTAVVVSNLGDPALTGDDLANALAKALDPTSSGTYTASLTGSDAAGKTFDISVSNGALILKSQDEGSAAKAIDDIKMTYANRDVTALAFHTTTKTQGSSATYEPNISIGDTIKIGNRIYEFTIGNRTEGKDDQGNYNTAVDLTGLASDGGNDISKMSMKDIVQKLADTIESTSANDLPPILTEVVEETTAPTATEPSKQTVTLKLTSKFKDDPSITKQFVAPEVEPPRTSHSLDLQIGDDAADYNRMEVTINAVNCSEMGLDGVNISSQSAARAAMAKIKEAINYVSDVRGTLGATQNRLDHTINNLSVMQENIQDAESTIRDTDVAKEMMAYTKNNILVQSAQAMLAQANQLPQGVLQLLQ